MSIDKGKNMSEIIQDKDYAKRVVEAKELTNPYLIYGMAIGGGCTEKEAKVHMMKYCKEVGLDPLCP